MNSTTDSIIEIQNLGFKRGERSIFDKVNIQVARGQVTAIMGPSGSGKTTLLRLIGGQLVPQEGTILVNGSNITKLKRDELYKVRKTMGMLFQSGALFSDLSVYDNVAFPLREHTNLPETMIRDLVLMKLHAVGLRGARELMPAQLSGGMQRRAALARTIALDPNLLMYDEPFAGQDPISMGMLVQLIRLLNDALGLTSIIVSHDVMETCSIADYAYVIAEGRVIGQGTPDELMKSQSSWLRQFMQGLPDGPVPFHYPAQNYATDLLEGREGL
ncbi:MAG TPA: ATP-binding cassette domain-containing protein [Gammaproteobacteria bacterium]|nr:ATP-binding cassette domain-containing protein [Gammaproteobacteria bacterium]